MEPYRCAIIGCGGRSYWHAYSYAKTNRGKLVACCSHDPELRRKFAAEFALTPYSDVAAMLKHEHIDLVHVVTQPTARVEVMQVIIDHAVPACILEKPVALQVNDWRALNVINAGALTKTGVSTQFRYHVNLRRCRDALCSGQLGKLEFLDASAGGVICDQGVHTLDWAMYLNNDIPVVRIFGAASGNREMTGRHPGPDNTEAQLLFANGVRGLWHLGSTAPRVLNDPAYYKHCRVAAYAESGHALFEEFGRWQVVSPSEVQAGEVADMDDWRAGNLAAQANLTNAMFDWLEGGEPVGTSLNRSLEQWNVVLGLYASVVFGGPVDLPFNPPDDLWLRLGETLKR